MNISNRHKIISIKNKSEIDIVFKNGKKIKTELGPIFLYIEKEESDNVRKVAILLKKSIGSAVTRNYIKRIIRYFIAQHQDLLTQFNRMIFLYNSKKDVSYSVMEKIYIRALQQ